MKIPPVSSRRHHSAQATLTVTAMASECNMIGYGRTMVTGPTLTSTWLGPE